MKHRKHSTDETGLWGEARAAKFLRRNGYRVIGRRVRIGTRDEIDIVARDGDTLVFVEVKTRATEDFGRPSDAVDRAKRRNLSRAAVRYLRKKKFPDVCFRFDIVEVIGSKDARESTIRHIENAFPLDRKYHLP